MCLGKSSLAANLGDGALAGTCSENPAPEEGVVMREVRGVPVTYNADLDGTYALFEVCGRRCFCAESTATLVPCGYVDVTRDINDVTTLDGHRLSMADLEKIPVHGGVTFSGRLDRYGLDGLWIGFDMAHGEDMGIVDMPACVGEICGVPLMGRLPKYGSIRNVDDAILVCIGFAHAIDEEIRAFAAKALV